jgi:hypothetical protein
VLDFRMEVEPVLPCAVLRPSSLAGRCIRMIGRGTLFFVLSMLGSFLLYPVLDGLRINDQLKSLIVQVWFISCLYWNMYFHTNWISKLYER